MSRLVFVKLFLQKRRVTNSNDDEFFQKRLAFSRLKLFVFNGGILQLCFDKNYNKCMGNCSTFNPYTSELYGKKEKLTARKKSSKPKRRLLTAKKENLAAEVKNSRRK